MGGTQQQFVVSSFLFFVVVGGHLEKQVFYTN